MKISLDCEHSNESMQLNNIGLNFVKNDTIIKTVIQMSSNCVQRAVRRKNRRCFDLHCWIFSKKRSCHTLCGYFIIPRDIIKLLLKVKLKWEWIKIHMRCREKYLRCKTCVSRCYWDINVLQKMLKHDKKKIKRENGNLLSEIVG